MNWYSCENRLGQVFLCLQQELWLLNIFEQNVHWNELMVVWSLSWIVSIAFDAYELLQYSHWNDSCVGSDSFRISIIFRKCSESFGLHSQDRLICRRHELCALNNFVQYGHLKNDSSLCKSSCTRRFAASMKHFSQNRHLYFAPSCIFLWRFSFRLELNLSLQ